MKDKEIIKEMAERIGNYSFCCKSAKDCYECEHNDMSIDASCTEIMCAKKLIEHYQPKLPKDSVVLTRRELFKDSSQLPKEKQVENIRNIILENLDYGYDETARAIYDADYRKIPKLGVILPFDHYDNLLKFDSEIRKETAEKFIDWLQGNELISLMFTKEYKRKLVDEFLSQNNSVWR